MIPPIFIHAAKAGQPGETDLTKEIQVHFARSGESPVARVAVLALVSLLLFGGVAFLTWRELASETSLLPSRVPEGINDAYRRPDVTGLIADLEAETREVYRERERIAALAGIEPGMDVADIGAGSGFMSAIFAQQAGPAGTVYVVDINPALLRRATTLAKKAGAAKIEAVLTPEDTVSLPRGSIDLAFLCDTYHHMEHPRDSLRSIRRALRRNGELVVVELDRQPGVSSPWVMGHVRGGKELFLGEIRRAGFRLVREEPAPFLKENYVLRFQKRGE